MAHQIRPINKRIGIKSSLSTDIYIKSDPYTNKIGFGQMNIQPRPDSLIILVNNVCNNNIYVLRACV